MGHGMDRIVHIEQGNVQVQRNKRQADALVTEEQRCDQKDAAKRTVNVQRQNEDWVISISDMGMGIPKEALPKIFERFSRVKRRGKQIQGTGSRLAVVHELVTIYGDRIEVEGEMDHGVTFTVFLPFDSKASPEVSSDEMDEFPENTLATAR
jgi:signal transduction histidine kinase